MSISYSKYGLYHFFSNEPNIIDVDSAIFDYSIQDEFGFTFSLYFSVYERYAIITLMYQKQETPIYDILISDVEEIRAKKEKLTVCSNDKEIRIFFKKGFSLEFNI